METLTGIETAEQLADKLCAAVKTSKWHTFVGAVNGKSVRVKAYRLWLQIFDVDGVRYGESDSFKTQAAMRGYILTTLR